MWHVNYDPDFKVWLDGLDEGVRRRILAALVALRVEGPRLERPYADTLKGSEFANMKELRVRADGRPYRVLFAFDPRREAILLVGGDKGADRRFYTLNIPIADARYRRHLARLDP